MSDDTDRYDDIVSGTIDDVKEAVEEDGLDPEKVLDAEKAGKDRVTLVQWLEERLERSVPEEVDVTTEEREALYVSMDMLPVQERTVTFFAGIILGIVLMTALVMGGVLGPDNEAAPDAVGAEVAQYLDANKAALLQGSPVPADATAVSVADITAVAGADLYEMTVVLEATVRNQTQSQEVPAYVTTDGRYLLFGTLFDTSRPVAEQTPTR